MHVYSTQVHDIEGPIHYTTFPYMPVCSIAVRYLMFHDIAIHYVHFVTVHYTKIHYIKKSVVELHDVYTCDCTGSCITLHRRHYMTLHSVT